MFFLQEGADKQFLLRRIEELQGGPQKSGPNKMDGIAEEKEKFLPPNALP